MQMIFLNLLLQVTKEKERHIISVSDSLSKTESCHMGTYWENKNIACQIEKDQNLARNSSNSTMLCRNCYENQMQWEPFH